MAHAIKLDMGCTRSPDERMFHVLWAAVIRQACEDYWMGRRHGWTQSTEFKKNTENIRAFQTAAGWLFSDDKHPRSFLWACDHLDLDPSNIRSKINTATAWRVARAQELRARVNSQKGGRPSRSRLIGSAIGSDEFTVSDVMERFSVDRQQANTYVQQWVTSEKLVLTGKRENPRTKPMNVYKFKEGAWT
jgi:hypothetical protein